jgi:large subunit ribosomal protein L17
MRHRKSGRKLKRTASHKKALLIALTTALLKNKKIKTTLAKAKEARPFAEKLITRAKNAVVNEENVPQKDVHTRREVYRYIKDRAVITELFTEIVPKISTRAGGYTRIVKLGQRLGDGAQMGVLELVDYNTGKETPKPVAKEKKVKKGWVKKASSKKKEEPKIEEVAKESVPKKLGRTPLYNEQI